MNIRKLRKHLPGMDVRRDGKKIHVSANGLGYRIDDQRRAGGEAAAADYIKSKIPAVTLPPKL
jgi:hypothetical protein